MIDSKMGLMGGYLDKIQEITVVVLTWTMALAGMTRPPISTAAVVRRNVYQTGGA